MSSKGPTNSSLTIRPMQFLVIISIYIIQCAAMNDVGNITLLNQPGVVGIWRWNNTVKYDPLSDFRNESARNYYDAWPEDMYDFKFPCEDRKSRLTLSNFTYSMNEGLIRSVQYYDLGIVYRFRPYWRRKRIMGCVDCTEMPAGFPTIYCEHHDLTSLYLFRFRQESYYASFGAHKESYRSSLNTRGLKVYHKEDTTAILTDGGTCGDCCDGRLSAGVAVADGFRAKQTIFQGLRFCVAMVAILQIAFAIIGLLIPVSLLNQKRGLDAVAGIVAGLLKHFNWGETVVEWLHLLALAVAGYTMIEGHGHSDPHHWRTSAMNALAYYYRVQTVCAFLSSFLRQCANSMKVILQSGQNLANSSSDKHRKMVIGQVVVCVVMVEYLYITDQNYLDFMIQVVLAVVAVAATVSMTIAISVGCKALHYMVKPPWHKVVIYGKRSPGVLIHLWHKMKKRIAAMMADNPAAGTSCQPQPGSSTVSPVPP